MGRFPRLHKVEGKSLRVWAQSPGMTILLAGWLTHHQEVPNLSEQATLGAGAADVLRQVGTVHGATDATLGQEACTPRRRIAEKGMVEITEAGGEVFLGLG